MDKQDSKDICRPGSSIGPDIYLIVLDSLRKDSVGVYSDQVVTPFLERIGDDSIILDNAISTGSWTVPAHGSLFTGLYPSSHNCTKDNRTLPPNHPTLAEVCKEQGYNTTAVSANPWISPDFNFFRGFGPTSEYLNQSIPYPDIEDPRDQLASNPPLLSRIQNLTKWLIEGNTRKRLWKSLYLKLFHTRDIANAERVTDSILEKKSSLSKDDPSFIFANYMDAHEPYFDDDRVENVYWNLESVNKKPGVNPDEIREKYAESVKELDSSMGDLIEELKMRGDYKDSLIILVGDHGQCLGENKYWGHGTFLYNTLVNVPLIVKPPGGISGPISEHRQFSIRRLFDLIIYASKGGNNIQQWFSSNCEEIVLAESAGPHMDIDVPTGKVSQDGYRRYLSSNWIAEKDLEKQQLSLLEGSEGLDNINREIENALNQSDFVFDRSEEDSDELDQSIKSQLEHLGYR